MAKSDESDIQAAGSRFYATSKQQPETVFANKPIYQMLNLNLQYGIISCSYLEGSL